MPQLRTDAAKIKHNKLKKINCKLKRNELLSYGNTEEPSMHITQKVKANLKRLHTIRRQL